MSTVLIFFSSLLSRNYGELSLPWSSHMKTQSRILVGNQLDADFFYDMFIWILYMFRATLCSSSGGKLYEYNFWYNYSVLVAVRYAGQDGTACNSILTRINEEANSSFSQFFDRDWKWISFKWFCENFITLELPITLRRDSSSVHYTTH